MLETSTSFISIYRSEGYVVKIAKEEEKNFILKKEWQTLMSISAHKNISRPISLISEKPFFSFAVEYCGPTLEEKKKALDSKNLLKIKEDIRTAIFFLKGLGIYHRDVCPQNIGVKKVAGKWRGKLFDFSLAWIDPKELRYGREGFKHPELGKTKFVWDMECELYSLDKCFE